MTEIVKLVRSRGEYDDGWNAAMDTVSEYIDGITAALDTSANHRTRRVADEVIQMLQTMGRKVREARR